VTEDPLRLDPKAALAVAISAVSLASVLIKLSEVSALAMAANRLLIAAAVILVISAPSLGPSLGDLRRLTSL